MDIDRNSPQYIQAVVEKKPHADDPKDIRIRGLIEQEFLQEPWAKEAFDGIRQTQVEYLRNVVLGVNDPEFVDKSTQEALETISGELRSEIVEGREKLAHIPKGSPVLIMTNHLGTYKLSGINPQRDLGEGVDIYDGYDFMYPYPLYFAGLYPVAKELGNKLSYSSDDFPGVYGKVHTEAGFIHVPPPGLVQTGRTEQLINQTKELITNQPHTAVVNFPEGGTSGKYNEAGPYDLLDFKTGGYVIAANVGMTILPVAQYFDPQKGMQLKVFEPLKILPEASREEYARVAGMHQQQMQEWLDAKQQASGVSASQLAA